VTPLLMQSPRWRAVYISYLRKLIAVMEAPDYLLSLRSALQFVSPLVLPDQVPLIASSLVSLKSACASLPLPPILLSDVSQWRAFDWPWDRAAFLGSIDQSITILNFIEFRAISR
jgi:hypothetical protein